MNDRFKKRRIRNNTKVLHDLPFLDNRFKIGNHVAETFKDIDRCFKLPCEKESKPCKYPYERLCCKRDNKISYTKACDKHGHVITATIEINSSWDVEISRFEPRVEGVEGSTFWTPHHAHAPEPDSPC